MDLKTLFLLFIIYSFIGWIIEMLVVAMQVGRFTSRGFLIGPYLPIFGVGAVLITLFLSKYSNDIFVLFIMSAFLGALLEYFVSYIFEKVFHARWWNYEKDRFNLNGRVCLSTTIGFGILGVMLIMFFNPMFLGIINNISEKTLTWTSIILAIIFTADVIVSFTTISKIKKVDKTVKKDNTAEITAKVRKTLKDKSVLGKRLMNAFPDFKIRNK